MQLSPLAIHTARVCLGGGVPQAMGKAANQCLVGGLFW